jgi:hypothetical protein
MNDVQLWEAQLYWLCDSHARASRCSDAVEPNEGAPKGAA